MSSSFWQQCGYPWLDGPDPKPRPSKTPEQWMEWYALLLRDVVMADDANRLEQVAKVGRSLAMANWQPSLLDQLSAETFASALAKENGEMARREYPYAVLDMNQAEDLRQSPQSCHRSATAATKAAEGLNKRDPNNRYIAVEWGAPATSREFWPDCIRLDN